MGKKSVSCGDPLYMLLLPGQQIQQESYTPLAADFFTFADWMVMSCQALDAWCHDGS